MQVDLVEIANNGCLHVRFIDNGGYLRECISPSDTSRIASLGFQKITDASAIAWTPLVISNWNAGKE